MSSGTQSGFEITAVIGAFDRQIRATYTIDNFNRTTNMRVANLRVFDGNTDRGLGRLVNGYGQRAAGGADRRSIDDGGHLLGARFGGPADPFNLVAMASANNRRAFNSFEAGLATVIGRDGTATMQVSIAYAGASARPAQVSASYTASGGRSNAIRMGQ